MSTFSTASFVSLAPKEALVAISEWNSGDPSPFEQIPDSELDSAVGHLLRTWQAIVSDPLALPSDMTLDVMDTDGEGHDLKVASSGDDLRATGALLCVGHLMFAIDRVNVGGEDDSARCLDWFRPLVEKESESQSGSTNGMESNFAGRVTWIFWLFLVAYLGLPTVREIEREEPYAAAIFESYLHTALENLNRLRRSRSRQSRMEGHLIDSACSLAISRLARLYGRLSRIEGARFEVRRDLRPSGPYSRMRLEELPLLAKRDATVCKRYGEKKVEKIFEVQLSYLLESLGFIVIQAVSGSRRVDPFCLAGGAEDRYSFLVEAKSTSAAYTFPTKDERALAEYVTHLRRSVEVLPPPAFVVLVGNAIAKTVQAKLRSFETANSIATRFISAGDMLAIRHALPGPVRSADFREAMLSSPHVVGQGLVDALSERHRAIASGFTGLIGTLLRPVSVVANRDTSDGKDSAGDDVVVVS